MTTSASNEPAVFVDRVAVPDLAWHPDDPACLYARCLTHLEIQVINLFAQGYSAKEVAIRRRVPTAYVHVLWKSIFRKLGMTSRYQVIIAWECPLFHEGLQALNLTPYPTHPL